MREKLFDMESINVDFDDITSSVIAIKAGQVCGKMFRYTNEIREILKCGKSLHFVNKDFWNNHDLLLLLLDITGPAHMIMSTYAVSETPARILTRLKDEKLLLSLTAIIDNRVDTRSAGSLQLLRSISDRISLAPCHAKVTLLYNNDYFITLVGSANYTENKRYEVGVLCDDKDTLDFHRSWIENAISEHGQYKP